MKKLSFLTMIIFVGLFFTTKSMAQDKKVALVTFYCDKKIGGPGVSVAAATLADDPNFNLKPVLEKAYNSFMTDFAKDFPFKIIDKSIVTGNEEYKNYQSKFMWDTTKSINKAMGVQYAVIDGMVFAYAAGTTLKDEKRDEVNLYKIFAKECDGVLFVNLDYEITPGFGGLYANVTAYFTMSLWDKDGKKVFRIRESGKSKGKVAAVGGIPIMSVEKIQPLCEDATDVLMSDLKDRLGKIVKKSAQF